MASQKEKGSCPFSTSPSSTSPLERREIGALIIQGGEKSGQILLILLLLIRGEKRKGEKGTYSSPKGERKEDRNQLTVRKKGKRKKK